MGYTKQQREAKLAEQSNKVEDNLKTSETKPDKIMMLQKIMKQNPINLNQLQGRKNFA